MKKFCEGNNCWITSILAVCVLSAMMGFGGCSTPAPTATPQAPATPAQQAVVDRAAAQRAIYSAKESYAIAERIAITYVELPRCKTPAVQPCSQQSIVDQLAKARNVARDALAAAQTAVDNPTFGRDVFGTFTTSAQASLTAFTTITATLNK